MVAEGLRRYDWTPAELEFVRGVIGITWAKAFRAGERSKEAA